MRDRQKLLDTLVSWINWSRETDLEGLLLGLGDYFSELWLIEDELGLSRTIPTSLIDEGAWKPKPTDAVWVK